jgi:hypothetical protein
MFRKYFNELWDLHQQWTKGVLYRDILQTKSAKIILSDIGGEYYNFADPTVTTFEELDLEEITKELESHNEKAAVVLNKVHQENGFMEYLVRNGFKFGGTDSWMGYDEKTYKDKEVHAKVVNVTPELFPDYNSVLGKVFVDFPGNEKYNEICQKTVTGEMKGDFAGLKSELYLIYDKQKLDTNSVYDNGKPAAGAGMFYSKEGNFAYLHDAGTLEEFRGKGYQSDLLKHRVNIALEHGIDRIYSSVEQGSTSWSNCIKCGLNDMHTGIIFVKR